MIDLQPAPVPELSDEWIVSRQSALVEALSERHQSPVRWMAVAGATAATTLATVFLTLFVIGGSAPDAFAGWTASPTTPAPGQLTAADTSCQSSLSQLRPTNKGGDITSLTPELSDVRGPYTVTLYGSSTGSEVMCVAGEGNTSVNWIAAPPSTAGPGAISVNHVSYLARDGQSYTLVAGQVGTGVTSVTLSLASGDTVTATIGNGYFVAWWPGSEGIVSAGVTTVTGTSTQTLNLAGPGNPPSTKPSPAGPGTVTSPGNSHTVCLVHSC